MADFVDHVTLHVRAGDGGDGCVSIRREKYKPFAGPDGGNGGDGGDIVLIADTNTTTLLGYHYRPHRSAESGTAGRGDDRHGARGARLELTVPVGTVVLDAAGEQLADLDRAGAELVVAAGGRGGLGNAALASARRKSPGFALLGTPGWEGTVTLELKTIADVGLVGYPSAGKSSLISALSAAKPKVADYPFTTLHPHLGVVDMGQSRYTIADVPGLIEGASSGRGLGHEFLRHVERCAALVHVLDCATLEPGRDPLSDLDVILAELGNYEVGPDQVPLTERPAVVALNKVDVPEAAELAQFVRGDLEERGFRVFEVSAASHTGLRQLSFALADIVEQARQEQAANEALAPRIVLRPRAVNDAPFTVTREVDGDDVAFVVRGPKPERWIAQTNFSNDEAVGYLAERLAKLGVEDELVRQGATPGATVVIGGDGGVVFDWEPTLTSAAEIMTASRDQEGRLDPSGRATRAERKENYHERMDAKARARAELEREREAGLWHDDAAEGETR